jgi:hypothetical protein
MKQQDLFLDACVSLKSIAGNGTLKELGVYYNKVVYEDGPVERVYYVPADYITTITARSNIQVGSASVKRPIVVAPAVRYMA